MSRVFDETGAEQLPAEFPSELNALALEYQGHYGSAGRNIDVSHFINNPAASGKIRVLGSGFEKEIADLFRVEVSPLLDDGANAFVIGLGRITSGFGGCDGEGRQWMREFERDGHPAHLLTCIHPNPDDVDQVSIVSPTEADLLAVGYVPKVRVEATEYEALADVLDAAATALRQAAQDK